MHAEVAPTGSIPPSRAGSKRSLTLFLFLSLLFSLTMSQAVVFDYETTYRVWLSWTIAWGVIWLGFALLQIRWWAKGYEKFWRPLYAWTLLGSIVLSLIFLPLLLWPRFRRWLFRVLKPQDPPGWDPALRTLARLRDDGILTDAEFDAKKDEILRGV